MSARWRPFGHYFDVIMGAIASQITSLMIVYSTVYLCADQRKHQSSAPLAFVWGIHRWPVNSPHKGPVTRKMCPLITSSCSGIDVFTLNHCYVLYFRPQSLILSNSARRNYSAGDIFNLMAIDANVVAKSTLYWHNVWSSPLTFTGWQKIFHPWYSAQYPLLRQLSLYLPLIIKSLQYIWTQGIRFSNELQWLNQPLQQQWLHTWIDDVIKWIHFPRYWPFVRGFTGHRWISLTKASDAELWCFIWTDQTID